MGPGWDCGIGYWNEFCRFGAYRRQSASKEACVQEVDVAHVVGGGAGRGLGK